MREIIQLIQQAHLAHEDASVLAKSRCRWGLTVGSEQPSVSAASCRRQGGIPFNAMMVPEVDIAGGRIVIDPPQGLFED